MKNKKLITLAVTVLSLSTFSIFSSKEIYASSNINNSAVATSSVKAQLVSGKITNKSTGSPVSDATIVYNSNKGKMYTAKTNASGEYKINIPASKYSVEVNCTGYKSYTQSIIVSNNKMLKRFNFQLKAEKTPTAFITMTTDKSSYSVNSQYIKVNITNGTTKESRYGYSYRIEYFDANSWQNIPLGLSFPDIVLTLKPGKTYTETISIIQDQYKYVAGKYRVVKNIGGQELTAEFTLK